MTDITPSVPQGRQLIQGYGNGGFRIGGNAHEGSVIVLPERTLPWTVTAYAEITFDSLAPVYADGAGIEVLLIGCGPRMEMPDTALRDALKTHNIVADVMDTGAACRTFNVLLAEDRAVAAALISVS